MDDWTCHKCQKILNHHDAWYCSHDGEQYCYAHLPEPYKKELWEKEDDHGKDVA